MNRDLFVVFFSSAADNEITATTTVVNGIELFGKRSVRLGTWKLLHMPEPYGSGEWQLYDLDRDLAETHDLAGKNPEKMAELLRIWKRYEVENQVILPDWVSGY